MARKKYKIEKLVFFIAIFVCSALLMQVSGYLFYNQAVVTDGSAYLSDLPAHIEFAKNGTGYSLIDLLIGRIVIWTSDVRYVAVFGGIIIALTFMVSVLFLVKLFDVNRWYSLFVSTVLIFLDSLYFPYISPYLDLTGFVRQPWHSFTYLGMRLFAIVTMFFFYNVYLNYEERVPIVQWIGCTLFLAVTTWIKPNFLIAFSLSLLVVLIYGIIKSKFSGSVFAKSFAVGCIVLPSVAIAYVQSTILFTGNMEESGIQFSVVGSAFMKNGVKAATLQVVGGLFLPFLVFFIFRKHMNREKRFVLLMFVVSFAQILLFSESGKRSFDNNFYWSIYLSSFFVFLYSMADTTILIKKAIMKCGNVRTRLTWITATVLVILLMLWHLSSGILHFYNCYRGVNYNYWPYVVEPYFPIFDKLLKLIIIL